MSQAEELLATLSETVVNHSHLMNDSDSYFVIDPTTRLMSNGSDEPSYIMQYDHDSVILTFELPRFVDGHDMTKCNRVLVHWNNISEFTVDERAESTEIDDLKINPKNESTVICSWQISRNSTQYSGKLTFLVQYKCVENGVTTYEWHTDIFDNVIIKSGRNNGEQSVIDYTDIIEQWRSKLFDVSDSVIADIATVSEEQKAAIAAKGEETLATIPEDYTTLSRIANNALRTRANAVVQTSEGESVVADDCSDDYLRGLYVYGRTKQIATTGAQLFDGTKITNLTGQGITMENDGLGRITLYGTATSTFSSVNIAITDLAPGTYSVSGEIEGKVFFYVRVTLANGTFKYYKAPIVFTLDGTETEILGYLYGPQGGVSFNGDVICPMLNSGTVALPWEPYSRGLPSPTPECPQQLINVENPTVSIFGKNLFNVNSIGSYSSITNNGNGTITAKVNTAQTVQTLATLCPALKVGDIATLSLTTPAIDANTGKPRDYIYLVQAKTVWNNGTSKIITKTMLDSFLYFYSSTDADGNGVDTVISEIQIELGETATDYEPYITPQSLALAYTLSGIPVESGGNYTDSNGQQWICDEIDFERGVYIQRTDTEEFDGSSDEIWYDELVLENTVMFRIEIPSSVNIGNIHGADFVCSHFRVKQIYNSDTHGAQHTMKQFYFRMPNDVLETNDADGLRVWLNANPITITYVLANPIETALTEEEIYAYSQLHTNSLVTATRNSENAYMALTYNADTKAYLEQVPNPTDDQVSAFVDAWLTAHFTSAEGVRF